VSQGDDIPAPPDYCFELEAEEAFGPFPYTPDEGIRHMEARIAGLLGEIEVVLLSPMGHDEDYLKSFNARVMPQLNNARQRLAQYKLQRDSRN
jgi:hypothetical protein